MTKVREKSRFPYCLLYMIQQVRKRTALKDITYSLYLYFSSISLRNISKAIAWFVTQSHTAIRY